ncbi:MAG: S-ribosylhomocysteine lyase [Firmicutes bacterium]|nr:S-ribosylhomocysteine lyase [Bacillota bacterium]
MKRIASFTVDHLRLLPGLYVSRRDRVGQEVITTLDLRLTRPNFEPVMNTAELHTIEHLGATYLRNAPGWGERVVYFGPMGCRTGFYLLLAGSYTSREVLELVRGCFAFIRDYSGSIPGASAGECGNWQDMNLPMAKYWAARYCAVLESAGDAQLNYPGEEDA